MTRPDRGRPGWIRFSGVGLEFAGAVAGFALVGYWVDRHYACSPWGVLIGSILGLVGGMYNLIRESLMAAREARRDDAESESKADRSERRP